MWGMMKGRRGGEQGLFPRPDNRGPGSLNSGSNSDSDSDDDNSGSGSN